MEGLQHKLRNLIQNSTNARTCVNVAATLNLAAKLKLNDHNKILKIGVVFPKFILHHPFSNFIS